MESTVRAELNEATAVRVTQPEIYAALNDGQREATARTLCAEKTVRVVARTGERLIRIGDCRVNHVEFSSAFSESGYIYGDSGSAEWASTSAYEWEISAAPANTYIDNLGLMRIPPEFMGQDAPTAGSWPHYWFTWGPHLVVDPPGAESFLLDLYCADPPAAAMILPTDIPVDLTEEYSRVAIDFALFALNLKLRRWRTAALAYNRYLAGLALIRAELDKKPDRRGLRTLPADVIRRYKEARA